VLYRGAGGWAPLDKACQNDPSRFLRKEPDVIRELPRPPFSLHIKLQNSGSDHYTRFTLSEEDILSWLCHAIIRLGMAGKKWLTSGILARPACWGGRRADEGQ
jgi:hypothetical protein